MKYFEEDDFWAGGDEHKAKLMRMVAAGYLARYSFGFQAQYPMEAEDLISEAVMVMLAALRKGNIRPERRQTMAYLSKIARNAMSALTIKRARSASAEGRYAERYAQEFIDGDDSGAFRDCPELPAKLRARIEKGLGGIE